jgi:hypothetical protein
MLRLYNTLTRQQEPFTPARGNAVRMYACGLTVYARGHIGNFRTFVCLDVLRRTLKYLCGQRSPRSSITRTWTTRRFGAGRRHVVQHRTVDHGVQATRTPRIEPLEKHRAR